MQQSIKQYKIELQLKARQDLADIVAYLGTFSPKTALEHYDKLIDEIATLSELPLRCPPAKNDEYAKKGWHYLVVIYYLVFFSVEDDTVKIQHIVDGRTNYK